MFQSGYYITAEQRLKDSTHVDTARQALRELAVHTLTEPGCSIFTVHHDPATPTRFVLWERFESKAALQQHFEEPHTQAYLALDLPEVVQRLVTDVI